MIKEISNLNKVYRHASRYLEIIRVIGTHGFAEIIRKSKLPHYFLRGRNVFQKNTIITITYSPYERIRMILEKLGPTFIKLGQIMSTRSDLIPLELILELEKLQDSVGFFSGENALIIIESELNKPVKELFKSFDIVPLAAASISQVHKAVLFNDDEIILKIQRPNIAGTIKVDLEIMLYIATMIEKHVSYMKTFNLVGIVQEFSKSIRKELDFTNEAANIERFSGIFKNDKTIYVPKCYHELSTKKIIAIEFIDGIKISDIDQLLIKDLSLKTIAANGVDAVLKQIFEHRFFHADLHSGNILVLQNNVISFIDFGMMGTLTNHLQEVLTSILVGVINKDIEKITRSILEITLASSDIDRANFGLQVEEIIDKHFHQSLQNLNLIEVFNDLHKLLVDNNLKMPENIYLFTRTLVMAQSFGIKLDPDFNISKHLKPYLRRLIKNKLYPKISINELFGFSNDLWKLLLDFPSEIQEMFKFIKKGKIKIDIQHNGFEKMLITHERISNRISYSVVLAAIIIGSALIVKSGIPPYWNGVPIIGLIGFSTAVILGFWLLISIMRHGKM